ncbi:MAG TPA: hypothetical protein VIN57_04480 [Magnetovibrio sp.]
MTLYSRRFFFSVALLAALLCGVQAQAQSSQDMELLTQQEHQSFSKRLQRATSSADRAHITAEMNRIVQERRLQLRQQQMGSNGNAGKGQGNAK